MTSLHDGCELKFVRVGVFRELPLFAAEAIVEGVPVTFVLLKEMLQCVFPVFCGLFTSGVFG